MDRATLDALLIAPLQRMEDLALALGVSLRTAYRHVDHLQQLGLVDTLLPGNLGRASSRLAYLTRAGLRCLAGGDRAEARHLARDWHTDLLSLARLLPRLPARITLQQVLPALFLACRQVAYGTGTSRARERSTRHTLNTLEGPLLHWYWTLDYRQAFNVRSRRFRLDVDAVLGICVTDGVTGVVTDVVMADQHAPVAGRAAAERVHDYQRQGSQDHGECWHAVWVLLDPGLGNLRALLPRLMALLAYRESAERWGCGGSFPPVLILTTSAHRAEVWRQAAREAALRLRTDPLEGVVQIAPPGTAACWPLSVPGTPLPRSVSEPPTSWIDLASGVPSQLTAVFGGAPGPAAALPPGLTASPLYPLAADVAGDDVEEEPVDPARSACNATRRPGDPACPRTRRGHEQMGAQLGTARSHPAATRSQLTHWSAPRLDELTLRLTRSHRERARPETPSRTSLDSGRRAQLRARLALTLTRREETLLELLALHPLAAQEDLACWIGVAPGWIDRLRRQLRRTGLVQAYRIPARALPLPLPSLPTPPSLSAALAPPAGSRLRATRWPEDTTDRGPRAPRGPGQATVSGISTATYVLRLTPLAWNYLAAVYRLPVRQLVGQALPVPAAALLDASTASASSRGTRTSEQAQHARQAPHDAHATGALRLPSNALHQASVHRFFTRLIQDARERAAQGVMGEGLLWWESGVACVRRYRTMGGRGTLRPDAAAEYQARGQRVRFWLEWDTGSMSAALLRQKLERYATYADTTAWRMEEAAAVPLLLIVVPEVAQEERVTRLVEELAERARLRWPGPLLIRITTAARLAQAGPLAPIWRSLVPEAMPLAAAPGGAHEAVGTAETTGYLGLLERVPPVPPAPPRFRSAVPSSHPPAVTPQRQPPEAEKQSPAASRPASVRPPIRAADRVGTAGQMNR